MYEAVLPQYRAEILSRLLKASGAYVFGQSALMIGAAEGIPRGSSNTCYSAFLDDREMWHDTVVDAFERAVDRGPVMVTSSCRVFGGRVYVVHPMSWASPVVCTVGQHVDQPAFIVSYPSMEGCPWYEIRVHQRYGTTVRHCAVRGVMYLVVAHDHVTDPGSRAVVPLAVTSCIVHACPAYFGVAPVGGEAPIRPLFEHVICSQAFIKPVTHDPFQPSALAAQTGGRAVLQDTMFGRLVSYQEPDARTISTSHVCMVRIVFHARGASAVGDGAYRFLCEVPPWLRWVPCGYGTVQVSSVSSSVRPLRPPESDDAQPPTMTGDLHIDPVYAWRARWDATQSMVRMVDQADRDWSSALYPLPSVSPLIDAMCPVLPMWAESALPDHVNDL